jgi:hypothetical protein
MFCREKQDNTQDTMQHPDAHDGRLKEIIIVATGNANEKMVSKTRA